MPNAYLELGNAMPYYRVKPTDLKIGIAQELRHTKDRKEAAQIARSKLRHHPTYYAVMPMAEEFMGIQERQVKPIYHHRKPLPPQMPQGWYGYGT